MARILGVCLILAAILLVIAGPVGLIGGDIVGGWYIALAVACLLGGLVLVFR